MRVQKLRTAAACAHVTCIRQLLQLSVCVMHTFRNHANVNPQLFHSQCLHVDNEILETDVQWSGSMCEGTSHGALSNAHIDVMTLHGQQQSVSS